MAAPTITKSEFKDIIEKCLETYDEPWTDMDVIQPIGFQFDKYQKDIFRKWFAETYAHIHTQVITICNQDHILKYKDIWCILSGICELNNPNINPVDIFTDYCFTQPTFMQAVYNEGKDYLDEQKLNLPVKI